MPEKTNNADNRIKQLFSGFSYACDTNENNLRRILRDNRDTEFGRRFGFSDISSAEEFSEAVPLSEYDDFREYIQRTYSGEDNILTAYPIRNFILSSGTKGTVKRFPLTEEALFRYSSHIIDIPTALTGADDQKMIHTSVFRPFGSKGETLLSSAHYRYIDSIGNLQEYLGGKKLLFSGRVTDVPYVKLRIMLAYEDLSAIQSIFLYDVLLLFRYLEKNRDMLLEDIKRGRISADLPEDIKEEINRLPAVDAGRIKELENIFSSGGGSFTASAIWKNLRYISGIGGRCFAMQTRMLKKYTEGIPIYYFGYASSEVMAGAALEMDKAEYVLCSDCAYFEFLPENSSETVTIKQLEIDGVYEPVVTTFSGLYRYKTGDLIKITGFKEQAPLFEVVGRKGDILNIAGEKIDTATMNDAMSRASEETSDIGDFCAAADYSVIPARFHIFAETKADEKQLSEVLDDKLKAVSADYEDIRELKMLGRPIVTCLENGFISGALFNEKGHNKPKLFLIQEQYEKLKQEVAKRERK